MKCFKCGQGAEIAGALYRQNEKGVPGIWACIRCASKESTADTALMEVMAIVEKDNLKPTVH